MNEAEIRKYASLMRELDLTGIEIDEKQGVIRLERERDGAGAGSLLAGAAPAQNAAASGMQGSAAPYSAAQYSAGAQYSPAAERPRPLRQSLRRRRITRRRTWRASSLPLWESFTPLRLRTPTPM